MSRKTLNLTSPNQQNQAVPKEDPGSNTSVGPESNNKSSSSEQINLTAFEPHRDQLYRNDNGTPANEIMILSTAYLVLKIINFYQTTCFRTETADVFPDDTENERIEQSHR